VAKAVAKEVELLAHLAAERRRTIRSSCELIRLFVLGQLLHEIAHLGVELKSF
jgi:hypothetical protein